MASLQEVTMVTLETTLNQLESSLAMVEEVHTTQIFFRFLTGKIHMYNSRAGETLFDIYTNLATELGWTVEETRIVLCGKMFEPTTDLEQVRNFISMVCAEGNPFLIRRTVV